MSVKPVIKSFLLADMVIKEAGTNKWSAIGIFEKIYSKIFPAIHNSLGLFISLADAEGAYDIRVEFCDSSDRKLALFEGMRIEIPHRLQLTSFGIQTRQLPIPAQGKYIFNLYFNNEHIGQIPIEAIQIP